MTGDLLAYLLAAALFAAFALGWLAHAIWFRAARAASPLEDRIAELTGELLVVEDARETERAAAEAREAALTAEHQAREDDLARRLRECEAELAAAMEGLAAARRGE